MWNWFAFQILAVHLQRVSLAQNTPWQEVMRTWTKVVAGDWRQLARGGGIAELSGLKFCRQNWSLPAPTLANCESSTVLHSNLWNKEKNIPTSRVDVKSKWDNAHKALSTVSDMFGQQTNVGHYWLTQLIPVQVPWSLCPVP